MVLIGATLYFIFEYDNPLTFQNMSLGNKVLNSIFSSVSPRTAGFNSIDLSGIRSGTVFLTCILMLIGGSPGSTAGGIKTTTFGVIILSIYHYIRNKNRTIVLGKEIPAKTINKAFIVSFVALFFISTFVILISMTNKDASFRSIVFEVFSAFNTVGLSLGLTSELNGLGKILIILAMYLGRVGTLTLILHLRINMITLKK